MIRPFQKSDIPAIVRIHEASGFDYKLPELDSPLFLTKLVAIEDGKLVGAAGLRLQAETYLWLDSSMPVDVRCRVVLQLSRSLVAEAWRAGLDSIVAWLPPSLPSTFLNFITKKLGWAPMRPGWQSWGKDI